VIFPVAFGTVTEYSKVPDAKLGTRDPAPKVRPASEASELGMESKLINPDSVETRLVPLKLKLTLDAAASPFKISELKVMTLLEETIPETVPVNVP
jgi:hypothetical protein